MKWTSYDYREGNVAFLGESAFSWTEDRISQRETGKRSQMTSVNRIAVYGRALFARPARLIGGIVMACALYEPCSLFGQWTQAGTILYPNSTTWNVGIGTSNPGAKLEVNGGGTNTGMLLYSGGTSNYTFLAIGRATFEAMIAMSPGPGNFSPASQAGDLVIRSEGKNILFTTDSGSTNQMYLKNGGWVGIGTVTPGQCGNSNVQPCLLTVNGAIGAKEIIVTNGITADYVFKPDYRLRPLTEVASFIQEHHHLPEIPSEAEVKENGISVGDMQVKLLAKVEELTLHLIQADEKNRELQQRIARLEAGAR